MMLSLVLAHWVHDLDPVLLRLTDSIAIRWYGVAYLAGFAAAYGLLALYIARGRVQLDAAQREYLFLAVIIGVLAGGRLGYMLLYDTAAFLGNPLIIVRVWEGGMASHGGFAGVLVALLVFSRRFHYDFWKLSDVAVTLAPAGLFFGRIANFINGELWGKVSDVPWAVVFPQSMPGYPLEWIEPRHPSQLYAAFLEGVVLFTLAQWRFWRSGGKVPAGVLAAEFLAAYGALRIIGEIFREPDASLILGMSRGIFYSLFFIAVGITIAILRRRRAASAKA